jgi:glycosyltransferase involved in cell wall biosynthesis
MKILYLTAGAAQMYCGSCLRDNALAAELRRQGHDVLLLPMYTPTRTDEPNASHEKVFFGGVSVYLEQYAPFLPRWLDKIWDAGPLLRWAARRKIQTAPKALGEMTVSMLQGADGRQRREIDKLTAWLRHEPPPDVVSLPYTLLIALAEPLKKALQRPVVCTLQGEDLFLEGLPEPYRTQSLELIRSQVKRVDAFVAVSEYYAEFMQKYLRIPPEKMRVVPLGINLEGYGMRETDQQRPFTVGYFARVAPEKGLHIAVAAHKILRQSIPDARLEAAGYLGAEHENYLREIQRNAGAGFSYRGEPDKEGKIKFLRGLDVLSVPATYDEPKGIFLLEAMACGVPVAQPRRGAFTEVVEKTGGGLLVEKDSPEALAAGWLELYRNPERAAELGRKGFAAVREHYSVGLMAERTVAVFKQLGPE